MPSPQFVRVCGRISQFKPDVSPPQGYCLIVDVGNKWYLAKGGKKGGAGRDLPAVMAHGALPAAEARDGVAVAAAAAAVWRTLSVKMSGSTIMASVDGKVLATETDEMHLHGMAAVGSGWHLAYDFALWPSE